MLKAKQAKAISLQVQGLNYSDVAKRVGVTPQTITQWRKQAEFRTAYDESLHALLDNSIPQAIEILLHCLKSNNESVALGAAKTILDRCGFHSTQRIETEGEITITVDIME